MLGPLGRIAGKFFNTKEHQKTQGHARSPEWPKYRKEYLKNHPECEACGSKTDTQVHHCLPFSLEFTGKQVRDMGVILDREFKDDDIITGRELELNMSNYVTLCEPKGPEGHHLLIGHGKNFHQFNPNVRKDAAKCLAEIKAKAGNKK